MDPSRHRCDPGGTCELLRRIAVSSHCSLRNDSSIDHHLTLSKDPFPESASTGNTRPLPYVVPKGKNLRRISIRSLLAWKSLTVKAGSGIRIGVRKTRHNTQWCNPSDCAANRSGFENGTASFGGCLALGSLETISH